MGRFDHHFQRALAGGAIDVKKTELVQALNTVTSEQVLRSNNLLQNARM
jgi:hypothetical protein